MNPPKNSIHSSDKTQYYYLGEDGRIYLVDWFYSFSKYVGEFIVFSERSPRGPDLLSRIYCMDLKVSNLTDPANKVFTPPRK